MVDIVNQYYMEYGKNEVECAKKYMKQNYNEIIGRKIRKIGIFYPVMNRGGVQRVISLQLPLFERLKYEIVLINEEISEDDYDIPPTVKRYTITKSRDIISGIKNYEQRAYELEKIIKNEQIDVFIHHGARLPFLVYDLMLANLMNVYTIIQKHQVFTQGFCDINDLFFTQIEIFKMINKLVVLSSVEETYWKTFGIDAIYVENPSNSELTDMKYNYDNDNIVWVGRLDSNSKQYMDVLEIAKKVLIKKSNINFLMYGSGNRTDISKLENDIKKEKLEGNVRFCGYEKNIKKIYQNARIHLVTSAYEAFPMGIYESRICGLPLVMYELPYLELLKEGKGFLASENGDIDGMANSICQILDDKKLEKQLQNEARQTLKLFTNDRLLDKWRKLLSETEEESVSVPENKEYEIIIQTMHKHFSVAEKKYKRLLWDSECEKVVFHAEKGLREGKQIVICPFGVVGKKIKAMLNENGIQESYILDNKLSKFNNQILTLEKVRKMDCSNLLFIICSESDEIKSLFYNNLISKTKKNNLVYYDENIS